METQTGFLGISSWAWCVMGVLALAGGAMVLCALVLFAFGVDIGGVLS